MGAGCVEGSYLAGFGLLFCILGGCLVAFRAICIDRDFVSVIKN